ncbi:hypothetical protein CDL12_04533 [Handroanthus impetiginosus]|uniref:Uncharacterized protein n=1 Tax=Handroanthus impetiginosus TaxID=429701 RepID=A0A2G9HZ06_9LAMI|nr:hypothetical protein CDL12_04533 [Handroanthus impetiginosus]
MSLSIHANMDVHSSINVPLPPPYNTKILQILTLTFPSNGGSITINIINITHNQIAQKGFSSIENKPQLWQQHHDGAEKDPVFTHISNQNAVISDSAIDGIGNEKEIRDGLNTRVLPKRKGKQSWLKMMGKCDIFDGKWVKDDSSPLYQPGSCPLMDESFNCYQNGRPDNGYEKFKWQPNHCNIPRLDGAKILKFLKGKRIVYVGDSLNRNMWESMVCLLRNSVKNKSRVFEASGKSEFKKEGTYSFLFTDYNFSAEYIRSAFLVQEWEMPINNGSKKETLRLDMVEKSYDSYKDADVLVFNTGNWWTHEKTSQGKGYYQEGNHVHEKLDVVEAFDKAMATWARWIEANIDPSKTRVFFRGYSFSHFSKGEWNSGGRCDSKEPIKDEKDLLSLGELSPPIPQMLDKAMERVKTSVFYLNVTKMTNYRRDAHPSIYRKPNMTQEEKHVFQTQQDCSHWCLPGVPDTWNQLLFAQLLLSDKQRQSKQKRYGKTGTLVD